MKINPSLRPFLLSFIVLFTSSCSTPVERLQQLSNRLGFSKQAILSSDFLHYIYSNSHSNQEGHIHVYIEGDGTPWISKYTVSADPTPRNPLALKLMAADNTASIYLSRPCYGERTNTYKCNPLIWTHQRYSPMVVTSMESALKKYLKDTAFSSISFIGYSGGGVLAMLLASRFEQTRSVVTIAANLDTELWTQLHDYSALKGSLNPAAQPVISSNIRQYHFIGGKDQNVPLAIVKSFIDKQKNSQTVILETFDHVCCWEQEWTKLLSQYNI